VIGGWFGWSREELLDLPFGEIETWLEALTSARRLNHG
jgi:hypothetical protein